MPSIFPSGLYLIRRLDRATRWPLTVTVPIVWTGLEFARSFLLTGFAWYYLGHTQHDYLPVIQIADLGGAYAVSFVLAAVNGWFAEVLLAFPKVACRLSAQVGHSLTVVARNAGGRRRLGFVPLVLGDGDARLRRLAVEPGCLSPGPRLALLQGNLDQRLRNEADADPQQALHANQEVLKYYWQMCGLAATQFPTPDLIVWPETSFPYHWYRLPRDLNKIPDATKEEARLVHGLLREMAKDSKTNQLFGLNSHALDEAGGAKPIQLRAADVGARERRWAFTTRFIRFPLANMCRCAAGCHSWTGSHPMISTMASASARSGRAFKLGDYHFGVIICNEDTDPFLARNYGRDESDGPAVDFLVNLSPTTVGSTAAANMASTSPSADFAPSKRVGPSPAPSTWEFPR